MALTKKVENQKSLNIKVSEDLDARLKIARKLARQQGKQFNVSAIVEKYLNRQVNMALKELGVENPGDCAKQQSLLD